VWFEPISPTAAGPCLVHLLQPARDFLERNLPAGWFELPVTANERLANTLGVMREVKSEAALGAQEFAVDSRMVAIIRAQDFVVANAQGRFAPVRAVRAGIADVGHLPGSRQIAVGAARERAHRADIDASPAFLASEPARFVGQDDRRDSARADAERLDVHALVADAHTAETKDAARGIVINQGRKLFLGIVQFFFDETGVIEAVPEGHILQLALAALVTYRAIERMIGEQELEHVLARAVHLHGIGPDDHAVGCDQSARGLELRHLFNFHQTHAACRLQREARIVAERRDLNSLPFRRFDNKSSLIRGDLVAIEREGNRLLFRHATPNEPRQSSRRACRHISRADDLRIRSATSLRC
jgi:hypothetical protein